MTTFRDALHIAQMTGMILGMPASVAPSLKRDLKIALHELELSVDTDILQRTTESGEGGAGALLGPKAEAAYGKLRELLAAEGINPDVLKPE